MAISDASEITTAHAPRGVAVSGAQHGGAYLRLRVMRMRREHSAARAGGRAAMKSRSRRQVGTTSRYTTTGTGSSRGEASPLPTERRGVPRFAVAYVP